MFAPNDLSQPNQAPGLETNNHDPSQFMLANMDFGRANLLICQKVAPEEEPEEKIKVPGDIKLLFDEMEEKLSEYDSEESPKANEKKEGELSPGGFNQNGSGVFRFSGFKGTNSFFSSKNPSSINGHSAVFMPNFNGNISNNSSRVAPMPQHDNLRDNKSTLSQSPKKLSESEESLMVQKIPFSSIKSSSTSNFFCPFCSQVVFYNENSDCYAYNVAGSQKRYLAHAECYSGSHNNNTKISLASDISLAEINPKGGFLNNIMSTEKFEDIKKAYFIKLEGFHPISSSRLFKVEKVCNEIYKTTDELQFLHLNLDSQGTSFFEPASHTLPFSEFRLVITVYLTHSQEDAYKFEFNIDLSSYRDQNEEVKSKSIELSYSQGGRLNIMFGADIYSNLTKEDFNRKLPYKPQYYHPIFYNTLMTFKYFMIALPLKRIAKKKPAPQSQPQTQADKVQQKAKAVLLSNSASFQKPSRLRIFQEHDTISQDNSKVFGHSSETFFDQKTSPLFPQMDTIKQTAPVQMTKSCLTADNSPTLKGANARLNQTTTEEANVPPHFDVYTNNLSASDTFLDNNPNNTSKQGEDLDGEFRLEEYLDKLPQFAKTYRGSKILQEYLVKATKQELDKITIRIANNVVDLMLDPYANYMVQILAKHCASEQRLILLQKIAPSIVRIACDKKGTYALQTIVSLINSNPEDLLMKSALSQHILDLSMDSQGNHVIQKLINAVSLKNIDFIYQPLLENFLHVATHSAGSLVFKQLIIKVEKLVNLKTAIVQIVYQEMENLVQDPYGNYVIQYVLEYYPKDCGLVQQKIINKLIPYSSQKFSSNIIEKCLAVGDYTLRKKVAGEILKNERLSDLLKNKYGNYVILHTLAICDGEDKQSIMQGIHKCVYSFQGTKYKLRWVKFLEENPLNIPWNTSIQGNRSQTRFNTQNDMMNPFSENYDAKQAKEEDLKKLEIVKKIWRDMNKEEKREPSPKHSHSHSRSNNKQHQQQQNFNSFEDYSDSNGSPCQIETNAGNFYPESYNFYMNANKMEDPRLKWF